MTTPAKLKLPVKDPRLVRRAPHVLSGVPVGLGIGITAR